MVRPNEDREDLRKKAKVYKRRFDAKLKHIKVILIASLKTMSSDEWNTFLEETKDAIIKNPTDFLGDHIPSTEITKEAINHVFSGFLQDIKVRKVQSFRGPSPYQSILIPRKHS